MHHVPKPTERDPRCLAPITNLARNQNNTKRIPDGGFH